MDGDGISFDRYVSRRGTLFGVALGSTFTLAARPVCAQTVIVTPSDGLDVAAVKVRTRDGKEMPAYRAKPASGTDFAVVLVVQEVFGLHAHIADICRRFAKAGYYAIAPDLYFRSGDAAKVDEVQTLIKDFVSKTLDDQVMGDFDSTAAFAKAEGKADLSKLGITGFCWGGRITWLYDAHNPAIKAAVAWYGPLGSRGSAKNPPDVVKELHGPVLGLYGGADS